MSDLNVPEQLYQYMVGGHRRFQAGMHREKHKSPSYQIKVRVDDFWSFKLKIAIVRSLRRVCISAPSDFECVYTSLQAVSFLVNCSESMHCVFTGGRHHKCGCYLSGCHTCTCYDLPKD